MGRASQKSIARSFNELEKKGTKWHLYRYVGMAGNYLLMMFYTTIGGWMLIYFFKMVKGDFVGLDADGVAQAFSNLTGDLKTMVIWMLVIVILGFLVCSMGLQSGVERINKTMMVVLFLLMVVLAINSSLLPGASEGLKFYLLPDFGKLTEYPISEVIFAAMGQAFFTLSCGIGALAIFGSYIGKERKLTGEAINILVLDTAVALIAGLIIFPACFAYGIDPGEGPGLIFVTLPNVFNHMAMGRLWGSLFFLFMTFAALTTIIAVFQNIISCVRDLWGWSLKKASLINGVLIAVLSLPCIFGMTIWSDFSFIGKSVLDLEDFIVSNNILPLGSLVYLLFCVNRYGWGWDNFIKEANTGRGISFPSKLRVYFTYILPIIILYIFLQGYWSLFQTL